MGQMIGQTWEEEMMERVRNEGLNTARRYLRAILERRFGPLPAELLQRIDSAQDVERLSDCVLQAVSINAPSELQL